jgi:polyisoprenyl-phosphate glycosyltransferase
MSGAPDVKVSILIPAYNEGVSIQGTVERAQAAARRAGLDCEIVVIDDGSTDDTGAKARGCAVTVLDHPQNAGYGRALKTGLRHASGDWIAIVDADGSYPVEALPELLAYVPHFDMVVGARTGTHYRGSSAKWVARVALQAMVRFVCGVRVPDVNSGMRVFRKSIALEHIASIGNGFSFTTTLTLAMLLEGHFVAYVPIDYRARVGKSKVVVHHELLRVLQILTMAIVTYNPIKLFLVLVGATLLGALLALGLDVWVARGAHAGLIVMLSACTALLLFALGLVTDILRRLPRRT